MTDWRERAECARDHDPEDWFPPAGRSAIPALLVCMRCPVRRPCLAYALSTEQGLSPDAVEGIWGGATRTERLRMLAAEPVGACRACHGPLYSRQARYCRTPQCRHQADLDYAAEQLTRDALRRQARRASA